MNKLVMIVFGLLTAGSIALTAQNVGVSDPIIDKPSVRSGSSTGGWFVGSGGSSRTK